MASSALTLVLIALFAGSASAARAAQEDDQSDELFDDGLDDLLSGTWSDETAADSPATPRSALREVKGHLELRARTFLRERNMRGNDDELILEGELELDFDLGENTSAYLRPRFSIDLTDEDADRFEPFEAYVDYRGDGWDLRAGELVENWGIVDTFNPIDVINRRDFGSDFLSPDRLGEIGVRVRRHFIGGRTIGEPTLSLYALPVFRPTLFPSSESRFSFSGATVFDETPGATPHGSERVFYAARLQSTLSTSALNADLQLLAARGPDRFPLILPKGTALSPFYYGSTTIGGGLRAVPNADVAGDFLASLTLKVEVAHKTPYRFDDTSFTTPEDYVQYVVGVDRLFPNVFVDNDQITLMVEYGGESGADDAASAIRPFQSDFVLRAFWEQGDFSRTSFETRAIVDTELSERIFEAIFERQLRVVHDDLKWFVHLQVFDAEDDAGLFSALPDNTSLTLGMRFEL